MTIAQDEYGIGAEELASIVSCGSLIAVPAHMQKPYAYSLFRPRYLPDTSLTRGWLQSLEKWREAVLILKVLLRLWRASGG